MNDAFEAHVALLTRYEELHPDLAPYLMEGRSGPALNHPLVFSMFHTDQMNAWANEQYRRKLDAMAQADAACHYHSYIWLHERPYRVEALQRIASRLCNSDFWDMVSAVWQDSENVWQHRTTWRNLWMSKMPGREMAMDEQEREQFGALPEMLTIYRGVKLRSAIRGLSWTLSRKKAEHFANRLVMKRQHPMVLACEVPKADTIAYLSGRQEAEIVVHPKVVNRLAIRQI